MQIYTPKYTDFRNRHSKLAGTELSIPQTQHGSRTEQAVFTVVTQQTQRQCFPCVLTLICVAFNAPFALCFRGMMLWLFATAF